MSELLSNSKRKYIENWRQSVYQYMENGTMCKVTVSEMTPEPPGYTNGYIKPSVEHVKAMVSSTYFSLVSFICLYYYKNSDSYHICPEI